MRLGIAGALALAAVAAAPAEGADRSVVFVLDASRSMSSNVDGRPKSSHVREVLTGFATEAAGRHPVGLAVFGGAETGSCSDVKLSLEPRPGNAAALKAALDSVEPKGSAPVSEALKQAFEFGARSGRPVSLVLVADSSDACGVDACAMARAIEARAPETEIHAIGFIATQPEKVAPLTCLAEATGGTFAIARSASDLRKAVSAVLSGLDVTSPPHGPVAAAAKSVVPPAPAAPAPAAPAAEPAPPAAAPAEETAEGRPAALSALAPVAAARQEQAPSAGDTAGEAPEPAARATLSLAVPVAPAVTAPAPAPPPGILAPRPPRIADVLSNAGGLGAFSALRGPLEQPGPKNSVVPAAVVSVPVALAASLAEHTPMLKRGVAWRVFQARTDEGGSPVLVAESSEAAPTLRLGAGEYVVHCTYGRAQATKRIRVGSSPLYERLVLNAGALRLAAVVGDDRTIPAAQVTFAIYRDDPQRPGEHVLVVPSVRAGLVSRLTEGTYHVVSRYGDGNAIVRANVRIEPGRLTDAVIHHKAARITLKLVNEPGGEALANTSWTVTTRTGETVQESIGAFPTHVLAAGDYTIVAHHDGRTYTHDFRVDSGSDREVEVIAAP